MKQRILIVDDEQDSREPLVTLLSTWGYEVEAAGDGAQAMELASVLRPAVAVVDLVMPGMDGIAVLKALRAELPACMAIMLTGHGTVESAVAAMKEGAYDYVTKPVDPRRLRALLEKAIEKAEVVQEVQVLRRQLKETRGLGTLLGTSQAMQSVFRQIEQASASTAPVLVLGESGTGKELVARTIHGLSARARGPFVAINCAAIPETLLESELFGHEKGAFTGALERRQGVFELADGGTLLLDEVLEMSPLLQAKYLRVLQDGTVRRLAGKAELKVDCRVIAATNKDPVQGMKEGRLREDLYYRLNVLNIMIPPLRERREDIPVLVEAFIAEFAERYGKHARGVDEKTERAIMQHRWPGNVRELRNVIERAVVGSEGDIITAGALTSSPAGPPPAPAAAAHGDDSLVLPLGTTVDEAERELILRTLASVGHNKSRAAKILGITPKTLHKKVTQYANPAASEPEVGVRAGR